MQRASAPAFLLLAAALPAALLLYDPGGPGFAAPKAAALLLIAALALPWLPTPGVRGWILLGGLMLTPLIALDPHAALWGRPPRAEGVLFFGAVLALARLARQLTTDDALGLDRVLHGAGAVLALTVLAGAFRLPIPGLPAGFTDGHGGTLGNPNAAGAVLAALLVHATARGGGFRALLPLYAAALFGTGSRAAWLAMLVGLAWLLPAGLLRRAALGMLAAGGLAVFAALSLRVEPAPSAALRLELWGAALRALAPVERDEDPLGRVRWLVGYGPEQQAEALERHRRPEQNAWEAGGHERVADRAHSLPLDLWLSFGLAGLAALAWMLRRVVRSAARVRAEAAGALALLIAALVGFLGPAEWLLLAVWLARLSPDAATVRESRYPGRRIAVALFAGLGWLAVMTGGPPATRLAAEREALEARYRTLAHTGAPAEQWRALAAAACQRAARRAQDGEAVLLCAQIAHQAGDVRQARTAAIRATALRPARPRAWLLRVLTEPARPQPALARLRHCVAPARLDPGTAAAMAAALQQVAAGRSAWTADSDYVELMRLLTK